MSKLLRHSATLAALSAATLGTPFLRAQASSTAHPRLSGNVVDSKLRRPLNGATPLLARQAVDKGSLAASEPLNDMKLVLRRSSDAQAALNSYLDDVQNAASPNFHKWLTPEQFGERFGASDADIAAVSQWLEGNGISISSISKSRTVITFSSTEAQFEHTFGAQMHHYDLHGEARVANSAVPSVPSALSPAIVGIATLGNATFRPLHTKPTLAKFTANSGWAKSGAVKSSAQDVQGTTPQFTSNISGANYPLVGPADFGLIYGVNTLWNSGVTGTGQSIAIVAESDVAQSDVDAFRKAFGLPATTVSQIVLGADPGLDASSGAEGEAVLDVEWAGAMAPAATVNLLIAESNATQTGILVAAEYAIDHNLSPVMDVSWGACELGLGASGNQYFDDLWSQAAAQGISVMVASGDAGSVGCDQNEYYSDYGQQVNGMASTQYNTAVGGTDFYGNADGANSYWTLANDPTTLQSAKSYVPESAWNDSCVSPLLLAHAADFGLTETTSGAICDNEYAFLDTTGGGGGVSQCTSSDQSTQGSCTGGHPAPVWQQSVSSIGATGKRHLPDVSFFAGAGLWGSAYAFCEADEATSDMCVNNSGTMTTLSAGGTSFASPAFAGIVALLNQQQGARQGNINKYLYALAAKQFANPTLAANCQSGAGADTSGCIFHDVVDGTISEPCAVGIIVDPSTGALCITIDSYNYVGATPGYAATAGYDMATGLGSLNAGLLASNWASVTSNDGATLTSHTISGPTSIVYGTATPSSITVKASTGTSTPSGTVAMLSTESDGSTLAIASGVLSNGTAQVSFDTLTPGSHQLYASYGGDASFGASSSQPTSFVVAKAATTMTAIASAVTVQAQHSSTIVVKVQASSLALNPTGAIVFTNQTTGKLLGSTALSALLDTSSGNSWAQASFLVQDSMLAGGNNVIVASYVGDSNYLSASSQTVNVAFVPFYVVTTSAPSIDIALSDTSHGSVTITVASSTGAAVNPAVLSLSCPAITIGGISCQFTNPVQNADGSMSYTLTLTANNLHSAVVKNTLPLQDQHGPGKEISMALLTGMALFLGRRKRWARTRSLASMAVLLLGIATLSGCAGSQAASTSPAVTNQLSVSATKIGFGSSLTMTATLVPVSNSGAPSGTVLFYDGATPLGSAPVVGGKASLTVSTLSIGTHTLTGSYSGDSTFMPSASSANTVSVSLATSLGVQVLDSSGNVATLALPITIH
ncbi:MAG: Ig-like domain repeat protein [Acidobacteriaceae bacterium]|nr:Ig-like domain repeat protein [Acidobacteriaceae bacterium]